MSRRLLLILGAVVAVLLIAAGVLGYLYYKTTKDLEYANEEIDVLYDELSAYGDVQAVYKAKKPLRGGADVRLDDFEKRDLPSYMVSESDIRNPQDVIGHYYKINISQGTTLSSDLISRELVDQMDRYLDIVADLFPVEPNVGDFYDLRLTTPIGQDYIVLAKKRVYNFYGSAMKAVMSENDIHRYKSALVDAYLNPGTLLYVTKYIEPATQQKPIIYYPVSDRVLEAMELDPNLADLAEQSIRDRQRTPFENGLDITKEQAAAISGGNSNMVGILREASNSVLRAGQESEIDSTDTTTEATGVDPNAVGSSSGNPTPAQSGSVDESEDSGSQGTLSNPSDAGPSTSTRGAGSTDPFYDSFYNPAEESGQ